MDGRVLELPSWTFHTSENRKCKLRSISFLVAPKLHHSRSNPRIMSNPFVRLEYFSGRYNKIRACLNLV